MPRALVKQSNYAPVLDGVAISKMRSSTSPSLSSLEYSSSLSESELSESELSGSDPPRAGAAPARPRAGPRAAAPRPPEASESKPSESRSEASLTLPGAAWLLRRPALRPGASPPPRPRRPRPPPRPGPARAGAAAAGGGGQLGQCHFTLRAGALVRPTQSRWNTFGQWPPPLSLRSQHSSSSFGLRQLGAASQVMCQPFESKLRSLSDSSSPPP